MGRIATELGALSSVPAFNIKVLKIKLWNFTNQGASTNYISLSTDPNLTTSGIVTTAEDFGCSSSLPGVYVNIPDTLSKSYINVTNTTSTAVCSASPVRTGLTTTSPQNFLFEVQVLVQA